MTGVPIGAEQVFFCLFAGAVMGTAFCALKLVMVGLGLKKLAAGILDFLYCTAVSAAIFLCELALNEGRPRFLDIAPMLAGWLSTYLLFDEAAVRFGGLLRRLISALTGFELRLAGAVKRRVKRLRGKFGRKNPKKVNKIKKFEKNEKNT